MHGEQRSAELSPWHSGRYLQFFVLDKTYRKTQITSVGLAPGNAANSNPFSEVCIAYGAVIESDSHKM